MHVGSTVIWPLGHWVPTPPYKPIRSGNRYEPEPRFKVSLDYASRTGRLNRRPIERNRSLCEAIGGCRKKCRGGEEAPDWIGEAHGDESSLSMN